MPQERPFIYNDRILPPSSKLRIATEQYKEKLINRGLTILQLEKYWQTNLAIKGRKADLDIIIPQFEDTQENLSKAISNGIEPIPVPKILTGPKGIDHLRTMYRGDITIPSLPQIRNNGEGGWYYVVTDQSVSQKQLETHFPTHQIEGMEFPTYILLMEHIKRLDNGNLPENHTIFNPNSTTFRLSGSMIEPSLSVNENNQPDVPGVSFNKNDLLIMTRLPTSAKPQQEPINMIDLLQMPAKPRIVA